MNGNKRQSRLMAVKSLAADIALSAARADSVTTAAISSAVTLAEYIDRSCRLAAIRAEKVLENIRNSHFTY